MTNPFPNYRFLVTAGALMLCMAALARAQTTRPAAGPGLPPVMQRLAERMATLNLTDDQKVQVQALKDEIAETVRGMGPGLKDLPPAERREKMRSALGDVREKLMAILTPEQKKQLRDGGPLAQRPLAQQVPGGPATAPSTTPSPGPSPGGASNAPMINRMRQAVIALGLTPEQTTQVNAIFDDAAQQAIQLRKEVAGEAKGERKDVRQKVQDLVQQTREKVAAVLTPEQRETLKDALPGRGEGAGKGLGKGPGAKRRAPAPATQPMGGGQAMNGAMDDTTGGSTLSDTTAAKAAAGSSPAKPAATLAIGSAAPAFTATRLTGTEATNKSFTGKPLVLAFGSLTSPSFRDRLPKLEQLKNKYRSRANVVVVYTREAHPADGWQVERNRDDKIEFNAPTTMKDRLALAAKLKDLSKTSLDLVVDGMDNATLTAFGGSPEGAVVISPAGTVIGTQTFCDPSGLPRMIDEAMKKSAVGSAQSAEQNGKSVADR